MARHGNSKGRMRLAPALLAAAGLVLTVPAASFALGANPAKSAASLHDLGALPFTPAKVDPKLARQVAAIIGTEGLRFTPANSGARKDRTVTVAVRVDDATARALSIRKAIETSSGTDTGRAAVLALAPTRYNLGIARGYQSFAQAPKPVVVTPGLRDLAMPDLANYRVDGASKSARPARFQPRIALEQEESAGRAPRTFTGLPDQAVDVSGSYRLGRNLNVTAGVRLSQERNRLAPMTDGEEDSRAVYVGTQIRF